MITYRLHLICHGKVSGGLHDAPLTPEGAAALAEAAETGGLPRPAKVYFAPLFCCEQTAELLYPNLLAQRADLLAPSAFARPREGAVAAVGQILQEMMRVGFTEAAVIADEAALAHILEACSWPEQPAESWTLEPGTGYTLLTDAALWMRSEKLELYDTVPSAAQNEAADDEAYLDYAESLLDEETI